MASANHHEMEWHLPPVSPSEDWTVTEIKTGAVVVVGVDTTLTPASLNRAFAAVLVGIALSNTDWLAIASASAPKSTSKRMRIEAAWTVTLTERSGTPSRDAI